MNAPDPAPGITLHVDNDRRDSLWGEPVADKRPRRLKKEPPRPEPWLCPKCGETAHVIPDHHAYLCAQYRKRRESPAAIE